MVTALKKALKALLTTCYSSLKTADISETSLKELALQLKQEVINNKAHALMTFFLLCGNSSLKEKIQPNQQVAVNKRFISYLQQLQKDYSFFFSNALSSKYEKGMFSSELASEEVQLIVDLDYEFNNQSKQGNKIKDIIQKETLDEMIKENERKRMLKPNAKKEKEKALSRKVIKSKQLPSSSGIPKELSNDNTKAPDTDSSKEPSNDNSPKIEIEVIKEPELVIHPKVIKEEKSVRSELLAFQEEMRKYNQLKDKDVDSLKAELAVIKGENVNTQRKLSDIEKKNEEFMALIFDLIPAKI